MPEPNEPLPVNVADALRRGNKIEAIKLLRQQTGLGLKEAKDAIEASDEGRVTNTNTLAPGEVPRSSRRLWLVVALIAAAIVIYYALRGGR